MADKKARWTRQDKDNIRRAGVEAARQRRGRLGLDQDDDDDNRTAERYLRTAQRRVKTQDDLNSLRASIRSASRGERGGRTGVRKFAGRNG